VLSQHPVQLVQIKFCPSGFLACCADHMDGQILKEEDVGSIQDGERSGEAWI
jgi:hypothetical protein